NLTKEISVLLDVDSRPAGSSPSVSPSPTATFDEASKKTRDEKRLEDLADLKTAISAALKIATSSSVLALCSSSPAPCSGSSNSLRPHVTDADGRGWVKVDISRQTAFPFITLPSDPLNNDNFFYQYKSDGINWEIDANLESDTYKSKLTQDKGNNDKLYEVGSKLDVIP
ncbi:hypothetical protein HY025_03500, partial [Candidatus Daviesbacteria bacterium]|nr:hypothetical protein [Candidatus Daviesbacteria bacterium]